MQKIFHFKLKFIVAFIITILTATTLTAVEPWSYRIVTDFAYYLSSKRQIESNVHFAPLDGIYNGLEARVTGTATYTIPVPFGENPLVCGNTVSFSGGLELTPVSLEPQLSIRFTPVAFLQFSAGTKLGTAWDCPFAKGTTLYNDTKHDFESIAPFSLLRMAAWVQGLFQFDLAAVFPGEWNHVVAVAAYKAEYWNNSAAADGQVWKWQGQTLYANGWQYYANIILGYQMPLKIQTIGILADIWGFINKNDFNSIYQDWNPSFMEITISPITVIKFNDRHSLTIQARFKSRRAFTTETSDNTDVLSAVYAGREWFYDRLAFSYTYSF